MSNREFLSAILLNAWPKPEHGEDFSTIRNPVYGGKIFISKHNDEESKLGADWFLTGREHRTTCINEGARLVLAVDAGFTEMKNGTNPTF